MDYDLKMYISGARKDQLLIWFLVSFTECCRCSRDTACIAVQMRNLRVERNCVIIQRKTTQPITFVSTKEESIYDERLHKTFEYFISKVYKVANGVFPKCFYWIQRIQWQKICQCSKRAQTCHSATSCVRVQDATTVPARHMWETGSLNQAQFIMLQWLSISLNSLNSVKVPLHLGKTPLFFVRICVILVFYLAIL